MNENQKNGLQQINKGELYEHRNLGEAIGQLRRAAVQRYGPLREAWAVRCTREGWRSPGLRVSSGYRGFRLNEAVGGSASSAHCVGWAFDLVPLNGRLAEFKAFCRVWLRDRAFDQLISEDENTAGVPRWMHIGYKNRQGGQRRQMLSMRGGKYRPMTA